MAGGPAVVRGLSLLALGAGLLSSGGPVEAQEVPLGYQFLGNGCCRFGSESPPHALRRYFDMPNATDCTAACDRDILCTGYGYSGVNAACDILYVEPVAINDNTACACFSRPSSTTTTSATTVSSTTSTISSTLTTATDTTVTTVTTVTTTAAPTPFVCTQSPGISTYGNCSAHSDCQGPDRAGLYCTCFGQCTNCSNGVGTCDTNSITRTCPAQCGSNVLAPGVPCSEHRTCGHRLFCAVTSVPGAFACDYCDEGPAYVLNNSFNGARPSKCDTTSTTAFTPTATTRTATTVTTDTTSTSTTLLCGGEPDPSLCVGQVPAICSNYFYYFTCANLCNSCPGSSGPGYSGPGGGLCVDSTNADGTIWVDADGVGCDQYVRFELCDFGTTFRGLNASTACCGCGGGVDMTSTQTTMTTTTATVTTTTQTTSTETTTSATTTSATTLTTSSLTDTTSTTTSSTTTSAPRCNGVLEDIEVCTEHRDLGNCNLSNVRRHCAIICGGECITSPPTQAPTSPTPAPTAPTASPTPAPTVPGVTDAPTDSSPPSAAPTASASPTASSAPTSEAPTPSLSPTSSPTVPNCLGSIEPESCSTKPCNSSVIRDLCPVTCETCPGPGVCNGVREPETCYTAFTSDNCTTVDGLSDICPVMCGTCVTTVSPSIAVPTSPTRAPSSSPSAAPSTDSPTTPTARPTAAPSTVEPTPTPTVTPTVTSSPSASEPTQSLSAMPTHRPSHTPTEQPTPAPTLSPAALPTRTPTLSPTRAPTVPPTTLCDALNAPADPELCATISTSNCTSAIVRGTCPRLCDACVPPVSAPTSAPTPLCSGYPPDAGNCENLEIGNCVSVIVHALCPRLCGVCTNAPTAPQRSGVGGLSEETTSAPTASGVVTTVAPPSSESTCCERTSDGIRICPGEVHESTSPCETCICFEGSVLCVPEC